MKFLISIAFGLLFFLASASCAARGKASAPEKSFSERKIISQLSPVSMLKDMQAENIRHGSGPTSYRTLRDPRMPGIASGSLPSGLQAAGGGYLDRLNKGAVHFGNLIGLLLIFPEHNFW